MPIKMGALMLVAKNVFGLVTRGEHTSLNEKVAGLLSEASNAVDRQGVSTVVVQQHPLGFLCVKWIFDASKSLRIHVWDESMHYRQEPNWPIHDHVFSFRSAVLLGRVQNKFYELSEQDVGQKCEIFEVDYAMEQSCLVRADHPAFLRMNSAEVYEAGQSYEVKSGALHRTALRSSFAVTALATHHDQDQWIRRPRVIGTADSPSLVYNRSVARSEKVHAQLEDARKALLALS